jgi:biopolymer transport protein ExbD
MMSRSAIAVLLLLLAGVQWTLSAPAQGDNVITVQQDGSVTWNLLPIKGDRELLRKLEEARKAKQEIHLQAVPNARYDAVVRVMSILQRYDVKIGIVNTRK